MKTASEKHLLKYEEHCKTLRILPSSRREATFTHFVNINLYIVFICQCLSVSLAKITELENKLEELFTEINFLQHRESIALYDLFCVFAKNKITVD